MLRSVHRECAGRVIEPRNFSNRGSRRCLFQSEGNILVKDGITPRSHRGLRAGHVHIGVSQEPGRPCHLRLDMRVGEAADLHPAFARLRLAVQRSEQAGDQRYPRVKETKPEETGDRESERSIVPRNRGNLLQGIPGREGSAITWNFWRERWREYQVPKPSQRNCKR